MKISRKSFLVATGSLATGAALPSGLAAAEQPEPIIDIHQHTGYKGRTDRQLLDHQLAMGVTTTVILPSARAFDRLPDGKRQDPERAATGDNQAAAALVSRHPPAFVRFANELPTIPSGLTTIGRFLEAGAIGIGESKFEIECDSPHIERLAEIAQSYAVPVLLHFQHARYNMGIERFHRILKKYPQVNFIGHAQTWWGNIDRNHSQPVMYPKGSVTAGGITDRLLGEYPNMYGDLSAGSGHNALVRDEAHARQFLARHQDKLMFGSDCNDLVGTIPQCTGARTISAVRRLAADKQVERKILYENAKRLLKL